MKILLVEDDEKIARAVKRGLETESFTVDVTDNGDDGLWLASERPYDVVILDIMLPGRNGYRVCSDLRASGNWTPVLMLTAKSGDLDEAEALDLGADDYLTKPFSFPVLVARLRALARRRGDGERLPIESGELRIDPNARRVWREGHEVELTARELDLLEFFLRRPNRVLSKHDVLNGVWEYDFHGDPNIVEVYVSRLRRKLGGRHDCAIRTVRGLGYRLVTDG